MTREMEGTEKNEDWESWQGGQGQWLQLENIHKSDPTEQDNAKQRL